MRKQGPGGNSDRPAPLGLHLVMGAETARKMANQTRNVEDGRVTYVWGLFVKPPE